MSIILSLAGDGVSSDLCRGKVIRISGKGVIRIYGTRTWEITDTVNDLCLCTGLFQHLPQGRPLMGFARLYLPLAIGPDVVAEVTFGFTQDQPAELVEYHTAGGTWQHLLCGRSGNSGLGNPCLGGCSVGMVDRSQVVVQVLPDHGVGIMACVALTVRD